MDELLGGVEPARLEVRNASREYKIAYLTAGSPSDPCVVVPPGGGATKEENLFWARELAAIGPFYVVTYDLRGTGGSEPRDRWAAAFANTTPVREMERVLGIPKKAQGGVDEAQQAAGAASDDTLGGLRTHAAKHRPAPLDPAISHALHDFDAYAEDAFAVLDELGIERAHFMGLSQGGALARIAAMLHPNRALSVVSCGSAASKLGLMMAAFSAGAEEFYDQLKAAKVYDEDGKPPWAAEARRATREEYVAWRGALVQIIAPGFDAAMYSEMSGRSWDARYMDEDDGAIAALAYEAWERQGKDKRHLDALARNYSVPMMLVHGRKDPVIHMSESQKLFAQSANCVLELHDFGHNFGPPRHQTALLGRIATFMKRGAIASTCTGGGTGGNAAPSPAAGLQIGTDTYAAGVSAELEAKLTLDSPIPELWDAFCTVQTAADTGFAFEILLQRLGLQHLNGQGLPLFLALRQVLEAAGLKFAQKKLLTDLHASMLRAQKVVAQVRGVAKPDVEAAKAAAEQTAERISRADLTRNEILVCGAGPVGLRAACELALLGFRVTVIEKRPNFSRANILTFWDETMSDMLALGAKSYFPSLQPTGTQKFLGTRQIQVCLLKTLLLFGGVVRYGMEICGLTPPATDGGKWHASFRAYIKHRRAAQTDAQARQSAERDQAETGAGASEAGDATGFQQSKNYGGKEAAHLETWEVEPAFIDGRAAAGDGSSSVAFDAYVIAEGGWSDSTRRLGFSKSVEIFKPVFGLVANLRYNPADLKERNMRSQIHFVLGPDWPLRDCPIQAEFIEYLKGETHFFALVVSKKNVLKDRTDAYLEKLTPEQQAQIPDEMIAVMRRDAQQKGLVDMGVLRRSYASGLACLATDNVDMEKLYQTVLDITQEMGLPASTEYFETNPVQLFDFSRRAHCIDPVRVLCSSPSDGTTDGASAPAGGQVLSPAEFLQGSGRGGVQALVLPVGDALQEPVWTQGLGINRGFHTAMNQAYACLLAREAKGGLEDAVRESCKVHEAVGKMTWGVGHSGLAGSGSGSVGLKPFKEWNANPRSRLPIK